MRAKLIGYWIATALIGLETLAGGVTDLMHGRAALVSGPFVLDIVTHLGYPAYVLVILGMWKVLGGIVLFAPGLPRLKEWAYAGIFFELGVRRRHGCYTATLLTRWSRQSFSLCSRLSHGR